MSSQFQALYQSQATLHSEHVVKYLVTLCRHFARKVPATWDETQGQIEFPVGVTTLTVCEKNQTLTFVCQGDSEQNVAAQRAVIDSHIDMFSRRESIALEWQTTACIVALHHLASRHSSYTASAFVIFGERSFL